MARATSNTASDAPRDAVALLRQDHRMVEALFAEFEDADENEQSSIAEQACQMLTVHTQIEEEILYPAAAEALSDDEEEAELVQEAHVEHTAAKELIARIEAMTPEDETYKATVTVLGEYIKHHIKEEENALFPALKRAKVDLKELGSQLAERKFALMEEMGIEPMEPAQPRKRAARSKAPPRGRQARAGARSRSARNTGHRAARH